MMCCTFTLYSLKWTQTCSHNQTLYNFHLHKWGPNTHMNFNEIHDSQLTREVGIFPFWQTNTLVRSCWVNLLYVTQKDAGGPVPFWTMLILLKLEHKTSFTQTHTQIWGLIFLFFNWFRSTQEEAKMQGTGWSVCMVLVVCKDKLT